MVLGLRSKHRKGSSVHVEYFVNVQEIKPWPPSQSLRSVQYVLLQWENGDQNSGSLSSVVGNGSVEFNESFVLPVTLCIEKRARDNFQKNCLEFYLYESRKDKAAKGQLLGTAIINLADFGIIVEDLAIRAIVNCKKSSKNAAQPVLYVHVRPIDKDSFNPSPIGSLSKEVSLDKNGGESLSKLMTEINDNESEVASFTDDDVSSHSSRTTSSSTIEANKASFSENKEVADGKGKVQENAQQSVKKISVDKIASEVVSSDAYIQDKQIMEDMKDSLENILGSKSSLDAIRKHTTPSETLTFNRRVHGVQGTDIANNKLKHTKSVQLPFSPAKAFGFSDLTRNIEKATEVDNFERADSSAADNAATEGNKPSDGFSDSKDECKSRIEMLEEELREAAVVEASLYSIVAEHGSSPNKVHAPARRLSRFYLHACRGTAHAKRANAARAAVSGLVLVSKSCGNDVPRLTFWLSNSIMLRAIVSQSVRETLHADGINVETNGGGMGSGGRSSLKWDRFGSTEKERNHMIQELDDWENLHTFEIALENVEAWIFSRIVESVWWQTLTPHMQSTAAKAGSRGSSSRKSKYVLGDQEQGSFSIDLWKKAFKDACERLCPIRAGGHECGCLPVLARLVMEQLVDRLDVAMFNAILRESDEDMPTDPVSDPICDPKVLPILAGRSSFGAGAQLKNAVSRKIHITWLSFMLSFVSQHLVIGFQLVYKCTPE
ncbi:hypothetical protein U1Q18_029017 [Sarracenia purpurea var. burkii]